MNLKGLYEELNGDYDDVLRRLISESFVEHLALKFLSEDSFALLSESIGGGDAETAFRAAHTLKGVAQNLGFSALARSASALTEALRPRSLNGSSGSLSGSSDALNGSANGTLSGAAELYRQVAADYDKTVTAIKAFAESRSDGGDEVKAK